MDVDKPITSRYAIDRSSWQGSNVTAPERSRNFVPSYQDFRAQTEQKVWYGWDNSFCPGVNEIFCPKDGPITLFMLVQKFLVSRVSPRQGPTLEGLTV